MSTPRHLWHHDLHRELAEESLNFCFLRFQPIYSRQDALSQVQRALDSLAVGSYDIWELYGVFDLLIRVWLPRGKTPDHLTQAFSDAIKSPHSECITNEFIAYATLSHWMWDDHKNVVEQARKAMRPEDVNRLNGTRRPRQLVEEYERQGWISPLVGAQMMKFFITVNDGGTNHGKNKKFEEKIVQTLASHDSVQMTAFFRGSGKARYLITGRIPNTKFEGLASFAEVVNTACQSLGQDGARITTLISTFHGSIDRREQLHVAGWVSQEGQRPIKRQRPLTIPTLNTITKQGDESTVLELKATAFRDLRAKGDKRPLKSPNEMVDEVARAVVGMLNAEGGHVVIGLAEASRCPIDRVTTHVSDCVPAGKCVCVGVEHDYGGSGKTWDDFARKLEPMVYGRINPSPEGLVNLDPVTYKGKTLATFSIEEPSEDQPFFLKRTKKADQEYFVRVGVRTIQKTGQEMETYRTFLRQRRNRSRND